MKNNKPKNHHFIPQWILRKFCNEDGELHSYNKVHHKIEKPKSTKSICSENHLYTLIHGTNELYDIETFYSNIEKEFSDLVGKIEAAKLEDADISLLGNISEAGKIVGCFISLSFWRLPSASDQARAAKSKLRKIYDNAGDENRKLVGRDRKFIRDLERRDGNVAIKISQFIVIPMLTAALDCTTSSRVWFHESDFDLVISDRPIICKIDEYFKLEGDFYMPISRRECLTNRPNLIKYFNNQVFANAEKIVVGSSQDSLITCINECYPINR